MTDPARLVHLPPGGRGSGRVRYGAAMALWQAGRISDAVLEVYRIASAHDGRDPAEDLRRLGLPVPDRPAEESPIRRLYSLARDHLLRLDHPGAAEVRAGLPADPGAEAAPPAQRHPVVDRWLGPALDAFAGPPALGAAIAGAAAALHWSGYDAYPPDRIGADFAAGHAFAPLIGGQAPFAAPDFEAGLFLIAPGLLYRDHHHPAPELYAPLTGPHDWRFGPGRPLISLPALRPLWNPPHRPHLTRVGAVPFLALYVWTRDVDLPAHVLDAADWADLAGGRHG